MQGQQTPDDDFAEKPKKKFKPIQGHYADLVARGITEETCKKCDYQIGELGDGTRVHIQLVKDETGKLIDQKTRDKDKKFSWLGTSEYKNSNGIIGSWSWPEKGKNVTITEGEIDRMSVSQAFDNKWPTGSLPNGADSVKKAILADYEKLCRFDTITLCFDGDEPGQKATKVACELLPVGKVKIMTLPKKDANAVLMDKALGPAALVRAFWDAKPWRPDGIREGREFTRERLKQKRRKGYTLRFPGLNDKLMGLRTAEVTTLTAGSGIGKSTIARDIAYQMRTQHGLKVGNVYLEEDNDTSVAAYCALHAGVPLKRLLSDPESLPDEQWDAALAAVVWDGMMFYDHFGSLESERLLTMMRYMAASGCSFIVLDHISIVTSGLESGSEGERKDIDILMTKLASFVKETGCGVIAIVHLKRSQGKNFNEGGQISLNDLRGSASIEQLSFNVIAVERDQQDEEKKLFAKLRVLKCRVTGDTGEADTIKWNVERGAYDLASPLDLPGAFDPQDMEGDTKF
ncbi:MULTISPECIES: DnaB-like helicase C-terminal domain-containing protein [unclassified Bradyrhizobium]|uniref:DnaB-like helicase C-terminal domain-containing protein n=1 Tax=unclassified Bradyrhizobium TaxID=2631580 RepID=UPI002916C7E0|nr:MULTISPECIES: DnaB-like helicase C-terminal domain-containing protein [unclassified Bradyrhizobium]